MSNSLKPTGNPEIYFVVSSKRYQYPVIPLAEGFAELGVPFSGSANYWRPAPHADHLIQWGPMSPGSIVVFNDAGPIQPFLDRARQAGCWTVCLDISDCFVRLPLAAQFDLVLRANWVPNAPGRRYPAHVKPWAFGLDRRIIGMTAGSHKKEPVLQRDYRMGHPIRVSIDAGGFYQAVSATLAVGRGVEDWNQCPTGPYHKLMYRQTARHHPAYYERLKVAVACACFAGEIKDGLLTRFDTWRLWEAWAAGCAPVHLDFDKYRATLPVQPRNRVHYFGLDYADLTRDLPSMTYACLYEIGQAGRAWALEHYSPVPTAERFLREVSLLS